jgi:hypothetical protein
MSIIVWDVNWKNPIDVSEERTGTINTDGK